MERAFRQPTILFYWILVNEIVQQNHQWMNFDSVLITSSKKKKECAEVKPFGLFVIEAIVTRLYEFIEGKLLILLNLIVLMYRITWFSFIWLPHSVWQLATVTSSYIIFRRYAELIIYLIKVHRRIFYYARNKQRIPLKKCKLYFSDFFVVVASANALHCCYQVVTAFAFFLLSIFVAIRESNFRRTTNVKNPGKSIVPTSALRHGDWRETQKRDQRPTNTLQKRWPAYMDMDTGLPRLGQKYV